uniref:Uncharacterized protein n=1 Tax=Picea glauca TaxID=3330 RepID=A0A101LUE5_PICGL|nr:hypothetical protein ABT39_MTgene2644 [Picea glauca]QHR88094.1 hypothetical protein Q903MT_gene2107 [Picea sitchensis]
MSSLLLAIIHVTRGFYGQVPCYIQVPRISIEPTRSDGTTEPTLLFAGHQSNTTVGLKPCSQKNESAYARIIEATRRLMLPHP